MNEASRSLTEATISQYDLVVANDITLQEAVRIGAVARKMGKPIFVSQILGFHIFYFNDLNGLTFDVPPLKTDKPGEYFMSATAK